MADFIGSTTALLKYAVERPGAEVHRRDRGGHPAPDAARPRPDKEFIPAPPEANCACNECPHMRRNTLEKLYLALRDLEPRIEMPSELRERARVPIDRMLALSN